MADEHPPRHFLKASFLKKWEEVPKEVWIAAERAAGFRPKMASDDPRYMTTYATAGFGTELISGCITHNGKEPEI